MTNATKASYCAFVRNRLSSLFQAACSKNMLPEVLPIYCAGSTVFELVFTPADWTTWSLVLGPQVPCKGGDYYST